MLGGAIRRTITEEVQALYVQRKARGAADARNVAEDNRCMSNCWGPIGVNKRRDQCCGEEG
jgi:hypothetical protein